uniref:Uncharacterized protein n=1 Tax=Magallana gigas TaxID=29159 RepID=K1PU41_MAGGI
MEDASIPSGPKSLKFTTGDEWTIIPVIIYDENSILDPQNISLEVMGKTVHITCIASVGSCNNTMEELMWYIKKKNMNEWEHIILQEDKTETMANLEKLKEKKQKTTTDYKTSND